ncbi:hypothetical protein D3C80_1723060 [compost metagenome]
MCLHSICNGCNIFRYQKRCITVYITDAEASAQVDDREINVQLFFHLAGEISDPFNSQLEALGFKNL